MEEIVRGVDQVEVGNDMGMRETFETVARLYREFVPKE